MVVAVVLLSAASASATPRVTLTGSINGRIAFPSLDGLRLVTVNPDGSGSWPIAIGSFQRPAYSPDGSLLAVQSDGAIWLFTAGGQRRMQISAPGTIANDPSWSPDGTVIAFDRSTGEGSAIDVVNADGTGEHEIATGSCSGQPAWSPDGTKIAFHKCAHGTSSIWLMNADGTDPTPLTTGPSDEDPAWSPDGQWIAFDGFRSGGYRQASLIRPDGTDEHQLTYGEAGVFPAWSPDSRQVAYATVDEIYVTTLDGQTIGPIAQGPGLGLAWQPLPGNGASGCTLRAGGQGDVLVGGDSSNVICGGNGPDVLRGGADADVIRGGGGNDHLVGGAGYDILLGGPGNDLIDARDGQGGDIVDGGAGFDTALVDPGDIVKNVERVEYVEPRNLARNRPVTASFSFAYGSPELAVDAQHLLWWASYYAPQWIEIDLGRPSVVREIQLEVAQSPPGHTVHLVYGGLEPNPQLLLHTFAGVTADRDVLAFSPSKPWRGIRYVRVQTLESPSWVAWKEIRILR